MKHWLLSVLLVVCGTVSAQITLVKDGKSSARIIVQDKMPNSKTSAQFLQRFLTEISGVALPIENDKTPRKGDILIAVRQWTYQPLCRYDRRDSEGQKALCGCSRRQKCTGDGTGYL